MRAYAPNGQEIEGTLERLSGRSDVDPESWKRNGDGDLGFEFGGWTEVFWDESRTEMRPKYNGHGHPEGDTPGTERIFLDTEGNEWPECKIELRDE